MHLPQIAAFPKAAEDPTDPGRAAHPAAEGDGFLAVFTGNADAGAADPSRPGPPAGARPLPVAFAELMDMPETEVLTTGASEKTDTMGAAPTRARRVPETLEVAETGELATPDATETEPAPVMDARPLVSDRSADADGQPADLPAAAPSSDGFFEAAIPDGWVLPGMAPSVPVTASHPTSPAPVPEALAQGHMAAGPSPDLAGIRVPIPLHAEVQQSAVSQDLAAAPRAATAGAQTVEKPAQPLQNGMPESAGTALRAAAFPIGPQATTLDPDRRAPVLLAGTAPEAAAVRPEGQARPEGMPGGQAAGVHPVDPAPSAAAQRDRADTATPAAHGQTAPAGTGTAMATAPREPVPAASGSRADARPAAEADAPAPQTPPQTETPTMPRSTAAAAPVGPGADPAAAAVGGGTGAPGAGTGLFGAEPAIPDAAFGDARGSTRGTTPAPLTVFHSPETPRLVALQIAEVVRASGDRAVELRLQPEELGRVQLTMSQDATGTLTVSLTVERAETLDLLRRNIDLLSADLHELGYQSIDFSFQGDGAGGDRNTRPDGRDGPGARDADSGKTSGTLPQSGGRGADASGDGIDIRI